MTGANAGRREHPIAAPLFHLVCRRGDDRQPDETREEAFRAGFPSTDRFFARFPDVEITGRSILDFGCGSGASCFWLAERGAARVVGVDIQSVDFAKRKLSSEYSQFADRIRFEQVEETKQPEIEPVDLVISKETFEHVADPARYVEAMKDFLAPGGELAIGFGPLWKAPWGGHIDFMTRFPWAHLIFPEEVVMTERRRFRPDEDARRYEDIRGGLNRITLGRFLAVMDQAGLECESMRINPRAGASSGLRGAMLTGMDLARHVPVAREYFTQSVYGIWRVADSGPPP